MDPDAPASCPAPPLEPDDDGPCWPDEPPPVPPLPGEPPVSPGMGSVAVPPPLWPLLGKLDEELLPDPDEDGDELPPGEPVEPGLPLGGEDAGGLGSPPELGGVITVCDMQPDNSSAPVATSAA